MSEPLAGIEITIEALFDELGALRKALASDEHDQASHLLAAHDARLRQYCLQQGDNAPVPLLQELLLLQQSLMADMIGLRDSAAAHLRTGHQSVRAAKAYHQAESLE